MASWRNGRRRALKKPRSYEHEGSTPSDATNFIISFTTMKKKQKQRNPFLVLAKKRNNSGPMSNKKDKRKSGKNKQAELLKEIYE